MKVGTAKNNQFSICHQTAHGSVQASTVDETGKIAAHNEIIALAMASEGSASSSQAEAPVATAIPLGASAAEDAFSAYIEAYSRVLDVSDKGTITKMQLVVRCDDLVSLENALASFKSGSPARAASAFTGSLLEGTTLGTGGDAVKVFTITTDNVPRDVKLLYSRLRSRSVSCRPALAALAAQAESASTKEHVQSAVAELFRRVDASAVSADAGRYLYRHELARAAQLRALVSLSPEAFEEGDTSDTSTGNTGLVFEDGTTESDISAKDPLLLAVEALFARRQAAGAVGGNAGAAAEHAALIARADELAAAGYFLGQVPRALPGDAKQLHLRNIHAADIAEADAAAGRVSLATAFDPSFKPWEAAAAIQGEEALSIADNVPASIGRVLLARSGGVASTEAGAGGAFARTAPDAKSVTIHGGVTSSLAAELCTVPADALQGGSSVVASLSLPSALGWSALLAPGSDALAGAEDVKAFTAKYAGGTAGAAVLLSSQYDAWSVACAAAAMAVADGVPVSALPKGMLALKPYALRHSGEGFKPATGAAPAAGAAAAEATTDGDAGGDEELKKLMPAAKKKSMQAQNEAAQKKKAALKAATSAKGKSLLSMMPATAQKKTGLSIGAGGVTVSLDGEDDEASSSPGIASLFDTDAADEGSASPAATGGADGAEGAEGKSMWVKWMTEGLRVVVTQGPFAQAQGEVVSLMAPDIPAANVRLVDLDMIEFLGEEALEPVRPSIPQHKCRAVSGPHKGARFTFVKMDPTDAQTAFVLDSRGIAHRSLLENLAVVSGQDDEALQAAALAAMDGPADAAVTKLLPTLFLGNGAVVLTENTIVAYAVTGCATGSQRESGGEPAVKESAAALGDDDTGDAPPAAASGGGTVAYSHAAGNATMVSSCSVPSAVGTPLAMIWVGSGLAPALAVLGEGGLAVVPWSLEHGGFTPDAACSCTWAGVFPADSAIVPSVGVASLRQLSASEAAAPVLVVGTAAGELVALHAGDLSIASESKFLHAADSVPSSVLALAMAAETAGGWYPTGDQCVAPDAAAAKSVEQALFIAVSPDSGAAPLETIVVGATATGPVTARLASQDVLAAIAEASDLHALTQSSQASAAVATVPLTLDGLASHLHGAQHAPASVNPDDVQLSDVSLNMAAKGASGVTSSGSALGGVWLSRRQSSLAAAGGTAALKVDDVDATAAIDAATESAADAVLKAATTAASGAGADEPSAEQVAAAEVAAASRPSQSVAITLPMRGPLALTDIAVQPTAGVRLDQAVAPLFDGSKSAGLRYAVPLPTADSWTVDAYVKADWLGSLRDEQGDDDTGAQADSARRSGGRSDAVRKAAEARQRKAKGGKGGAASGGAAAGPAGEGTSVSWTKVGASGTPVLLLAPRQVPVRSALSVAMVPCGQTWGDVAKQVSVGGAGGKGKGKKKPKKFTKAPSMEWWLFSTADTLMRRTTKIPVDDASVQTGVAVLQPNQMPAAPGAYTLQLRATGVKPPLGELTFAVGDVQIPPSGLRPIVTGTCAKRVPDLAMDVTEPQFALVAGDSGAVSLVVWGRTGSGQSRIAATACDSSSSYLQPGQWHFVSASFDAGAKTLSAFVDAKATHAPWTQQAITAGTARRSIVVAGAVGDLASPSRAGLAGHWNLAVHSDDAETQQFAIFLRPVHAEETPSKMAGWVLPASASPTLSSCAPSTLLGESPPPIEGVIPVTGTLPRGTSTTTAKLTFEAGDGSVFHVLVSAAGDAQSDTLRGEVTIKHAAEGAAAEAQAQSISGTVELSRPKLDVPEGDTAAAPAVLDVDELTTAHVAAGRKHSTAVALASAAAAAAGKDVPQTSRGSAGIASLCRLTGEELLIGMDGAGRSWQGSIVGVALRRGTYDRVGCKLHAQQSPEAAAVQKYSSLVEAFPLVGETTSLLRNLSPLGEDELWPQARFGTVFVPGSLTEAEGGTQLQSMRVPCTSDATSFAVSVYVHPLASRGTLPPLPSDAYVTHLALNALVNDSPVAWSGAEPECSALLVLPPARCEPGGLATSVSPVPCSAVTVTLTSLNNSDLSALESVRVLLGGPTGAGLAAAPASGPVPLGTRLSWFRSLKQLCGESQELESPAALALLWGALMRPGTDVAGMDDAARGTALGLIAQHAVADPAAAAAAATDESQTAEAPWAGADWGVFFEHNIANNTSFSGTVAAAELLRKLLQGVAANGGRAGAASQMQRVHDPIIAGAAQWLRAAVAGEASAAHRATAPICCALLALSCEPAATLREVAPILQQVSTQLLRVEEFAEEHAVLREVFGCHARLLNAPWGLTDGGHTSALHHSLASAARSTAVVTPGTMQRHVPVGAALKDSFTAALAETRPKTRPETLLQHMCQGTLNGTITSHEPVASMWLDMGRPVQLSSVNLAAVARLGTDTAARVRVIAHSEAPETQVVDTASLVPTFAPVGDMGEKGNAAISQKVKLYQGNTVACSDNSGNAFATCQTGFPGAGKWQVVYRLRKNSDVGAAGTNPGSCVYAGLIEQRGDRNWQMAQASFTAQPDLWTCGMTDSYAYHNNQSHSTGVNAPLGKSMRITYDFDAGKWFVAVSKPGSQDEFGADKQVANCKGPKAGSTNMFFPTVFMTTPKVCVSIDSITCVTGSGLQTQKLTATAPGAQLAELPLVKQGTKPTSTQTVSGQVLQQRGADSLEDVQHAYGEMTPWLRSRQLPFGGKSAMSADGEKAMQAVFESQERNTAGASAMQVPTTARYLELRVEAAHVPDKGAAAGSGGGGAAAGDAPKSPFAVIGDALQAEKAKEKDAEQQKPVSCTVQFSFTPFGTAGEFVPKAADAATRDPAHLKQAMESASWDLGEAYTAFSAHREKIALHLQRAQAAGGTARTRELDAIPPLKGLELQKYYSCALELSVSMRRVQYLQQQARRAGVPLAISDAQATAALAEPTLRSEQLAWTAQVLLQCTQSLWTACKHDASAVSWRASQLSTLFQAFAASRPPTSGARAIAADVLKVALDSASGTQDGAIACSEWIVDAVRTAALAVGGGNQQVMSVLCLLATSACTKQVAADESCVSAQQLLVRNPMLLALLGLIKSGKSSAEPAVAAWGALLLSRVLPEAAAEFAKLHPGASDKNTTAASASAVPAMPPPPGPVVLSRAQSAGGVPSTTSAAELLGGTMSTPEAVLGLLLGALIHFTSPPRQPVALALLRALSAVSAVLPQETVAHTLVAAPSFKQLLLHTAEASDPYLRNGVFQLVAGLNTGDADSATVRQAVQRIVQGLLSADTLPVQVNFLLQCLQAVLVGPTVPSSKPRRRSKLGKKVVNFGSGAAASGAEGTPSAGDGALPPPPSLTLSRNVSAPGASHIALARSATDAGLGGGGAFASRFVVPRSASRGMSTGIAVALVNVLQRTRLTGTHASTAWQHALELLIEFAGPATLIAALAQSSPQKSSAATAPAATADASAAGAVLARIVRAAMAAASDDIAIVAPKILRLVRKAVLRGDAESSLGHSHGTAAKVQRALLHMLGGQLLGVANAGNAAAAGLLQRLLALLAEAYAAAPCAADGADPRDVFALLRTCTGILAQTDCLSDAALLALLDAALSVVRAAGDSGKLVLPARVLSALSASPATLKQLATTSEAGGSAEDAAIAAAVAEAGVVEEDATGADSAVLGALGGSLSESEALARARRSATAWLQSDERCQALRSELANAATDSVEPCVLQLLQWLTRPGVSDALAAVGRDPLTSSADEPGLALTLKPVGITALQEAQEGGDRVALGSVAALVVDVITVDIGSDEYGGRACLDLCLEVLQSTKLLQSASDSDASITAVACVARRLVTSEELAEHLSSALLRVVPALASSAGSAAASNSSQLASPTQALAWLMGGEGNLSSEQDDDVTAGCTVRHSSSGTLGVAAFLKTQNKHEAYLAQQGARKRHLAVLKQSRNIAMVDDLLHVDSALMPALAKQLVGPARIHACATSDEPQDAAHDWGMLPATALLSDVFGPVSVAEEDAAAALKAHSGTAVGKASPVALRADKNGEVHILLDLAAPTVITSVQMGIVSEDSVPGVVLVDVGEAPVGQKERLFTVASAPVGKAVAAEAARRVFQKVKKNTAGAAAAQSTAAPLGGSSEGLAVRLASGAVNATIQAQSIQVGTSVRITLRCNPGQSVEISSLHVRGTALLGQKPTAAASQKPFLLALNLLHAACRAYGDVAATLCTERKPLMDMLQAVMPHSVSFFVGSHIRAVAAMFAAASSEVSRGIMDKALGNSAQDSVYPMVTAVVQSVSDTAPFAAFVAHVTALLASAPASSTADLAAAVTALTQAVLSVQAQSPSLAGVLSPDAAGALCVPALALLLHTDTSADVATALARLLVAVLGSGCYASLHERLCASAESALSAADSTRASGATAADVADAAARYKLAVGASGALLGSLAGTHMEPAAAGKLPLVQALMAALDSSLAHCGSDSAASALARTLLQALTLGATNNAALKSYFGLELLPKVMSSLSAVTASASRMASVFQVALQLIRTCVNFHPENQGRIGQQLLQQMTSIATMNPFLHRLLVDSTVAKEQVAAAVAHPADGAFVRAAVGAPGGDGAGGGSTKALLQQVQNAYAGIQFCEQLPACASANSSYALAGGNMSISSTKYDQVFAYMSLSLPQSGVFQWTLDVSSVQHVMYFGVGSLQMELTGFNPSASPNFVLAGPNAQVINNNGTQTSNSVMYSNYLSGGSMNTKFTLVADMEAGTLSFFTEHCADPFLISDKLHEMEAPLYPVIATYYPCTIAIEDFAVVAAPKPADVGSIVFADSQLPAVPKSTSLASATSTAVLPQDGPTVTNASEDSSLSADALAHLTPLDTRVSHSSATVSDVLASNGVTAGDTISVFVRGPSGLLGVPASATLAQVARGLKQLGAPAAASGAGTPAAASGAASRLGFDLVQLTYAVQWRLGGSGAAPQLPLPPADSTDSSPVFRWIAENGGLPQLVTLMRKRIAEVSGEEDLSSGGDAAGATKNKKKTKKNKKQVVPADISGNDWFGFLRALESYVTLPGFATAFISDENCMALLLHALVFKQEHDLKLPQPSSAACEDPASAVLPALEHLFLVDVENAQAVRTAAVSSGALDVLAMRLGQLQGTGPRDEKWVEQFEDPAVVAKRHADRKAKKDAAEARKAKGGDGEFWAKGTGYGYDGAEGTDAAHEVEAALQRKLSRQAKSVRMLGVLAAAATTPKGVASGAVTLPADAGERLEKSCLLPVLQSFLRSTEIDIFAFPRMYTGIYSAVASFAASPQLVYLLGDLPEQSRSVAELILEQQELANDFLEGELAEIEGGERTAADLADDGIFTESQPVPEGTVAELQTDLHKQLDAMPAAQSGKAAPPAVQTLLMQLLSAAAQTCKLGLAALAAKKKAEEEAAAAAAAAASAAKGGAAAAAATPAPAAAGAGGGDDLHVVGGSNGDDDTLKSLYCETLKGHAYDTANFNLPSGGFRSVFSADIKSAAKSMAATVTKRVKAELRGMKKGLPLSWESTVLLRYEKRRPYILQALIFGPDNTPYDSGAFVFDIFCGANYPNGPPSCKIITTGGGSFRFNPNLYANGKVCLSLLGTWSGGSKTEEWNAETSTMLQMLVSIQALIMVPEPAFNEPGYERQRGTPEGDRLVRYADNGGYEKLREGNLKWAMIDQLKNPPEGFEEAVKSHFRLKRKYIGLLVERWLAEAATSTDSGHATRLKKLWEELQELLAALGESPCDRSAPDPAAAAGDSQAAAPADSAAPADGADSAERQAQIKQVLELLAGSVDEGAVRAALEDSKWSTEDAVDKLLAAA